MKYQTTNLSLLRRARDGDEDAWVDFYKLYWQPTFLFALKFELQECDAEDVLQEVMVDLLRALQNYDPVRGKFRNYLLTITKRKIYKFFKKKGRLPSFSWDSSKNESKQALEELIGSEDDPEFEEEDFFQWRMAILESCLFELKNHSSIAVENFQIFAAYALKGKSAKEVAEEFETSTSNVYQVRRRFFLRLREMILEKLGIGEEDDIETMPAPGFDKMLLRSLKKAVVPESEIDQTIIFQRLGLASSLLKEIPAPVSRPALLYKFEGNTHAVEIGEELSVGRETNNTLSIPAAFLSRFHFKITMTSEELALLTEGSTKNGMSVNGQQVTDAIELINGDFITAGQILFVFITADELIS